MTGTRTYPEGVPSWIDIEQADLAAAQEFYGGLFGWTFEADAGPDPGAAYVIARLDGREAAGLGAARDAGRCRAAPTWNTYVAVADADAVGRRIVEAGGRIVTAPTDVDGAGRAADGRGPRRCRVPALAGRAATRGAGRERARRMELRGPAHVGPRRAAVLRLGVRVGVRRPRIRDPDPLPGIRRPPGGDGRSRHPGTPGERRHPAPLRGRDRLARPCSRRRAAALARELHRRRPRPERGGGGAARRHRAGDDRHATGHERRSSAIRRAASSRRASSSRPIGESPSARRGRMTRHRPLW